MGKEIGRNGEKPMASFLSMVSGMWDLSYIKDLTHWGRVTHICVSKIIIIGSDNGLSPGRRQAIIWTNAGILLIEPLRTNFSEILIEIHTFSFKKMHLKMSSAKWRLFGRGLNELTQAWHAVSPLLMYWSYHSLPLSSMYRLLSLPETVRATEDSR